MLAYHVYLYGYRARSSLLCQSTPGAAADHDGGLGAEAQDGAVSLVNCRSWSLGLSFRKVDLHADVEASHRSGSALMGILRRAP